MVLDRPTIGGVMIWRWFTDPNAGGLTDTDFTVQGKPAEHVLRCACDTKLRPQLKELLLESGATRRKSVRSPAMHCGQHR